MMSKVSYEEAINSNSVLKELITEGYKTINNFPLEQYFIHEENVKNFINQHRPPSFDEVVKAWEDLGYELHEHCIYFVGDINCRLENKGTIIYLSNVGIEVVFEGKDAKLSNKELEALNLTIRYLESQKENSNG